MSTTAELRRSSGSGRRSTSTSGLVAYHFFLDEDGTEGSNVQVHANAAPMDAYLPVVQEKIGQALQLADATSIEAYGTPGPVLQEVLHLNAEQGVPVRVLLPSHLRGFTRDAA